MNTRNVNRSNSSNEFFQLDNSGKRLIAVPASSQIMSQSNKKGKKHPQSVNTDNTGEAPETDRAMQHETGSPPNVTTSERNMNSILDESSQSHDNGFNRTLSNESLHHNMAGTNITAPEINNAQHPNNQGNFTNWPESISMSIMQPYSHVASNHTERSFAPPPATAHSSKDPRFSSHPPYPSYPQSNGGRILNANASQFSGAPLPTPANSTFFHPSQPQGQTQNQIGNVGNAMNSLTMSSQQTSSHNSQTAMSEDELRNAFEAWLIALHPENRKQALGFANLAQIHERRDQNNPPPLSQNNAPYAFPQGNHDAHNTSTTAVYGSPLPISQVAQTSMHQNHTSENASQLHNAQIPARTQAENIWQFHEYTRHFFQQPQPQQPNQNMQSHTHGHSRQQQQARTSQPHNHFQNAYHQQQMHAFLQAPLRAQAQPAFHHTTPVNRTAGRQFLRNLEPPQFSGNNDTLSPYDFLEYLEKYQIATGLTDSEIIYGIIPFALTGDAYSWFLTEQHVSSFSDLDEFSARFRRNFQSYSYMQELEEELERRTQDEDESLTKYINKILEYYRRLSRQINDREVIQRIIRKLNPTYATHFRRASDFSSLYHFKEEAEIVDAQIARIKNYRPPITSISHGTAFHAKTHSHLKYTGGFMNKQGDSYRNHGRDFGTRDNTGENYYESRPPSPYYHDPPRTRDFRERREQSPYNNDTFRTRENSGDRSFINSHPQERKVSFTNDRSSSPHSNGNIHTRTSRHDDYDRNRSRPPSQDRSSSHSQTEQRSARSPTPYRNDRSTSRERNPNIKCFTCGENHYASECKKQNQGNGQNLSQRRQ